MITIPLIKKITELFIIMFVGAAFVKLGVLKADDSKIIAKICMYFVTPCLIFNSFRKELTPEVRQGLIVGLVLSLVFHTVFIVVAAILKKVWHASVVERASIIFANGGNLIIPIVSYVLGTEWLIYMSGFMFIFNVIFWTYGLGLFDTESRASVKKILLNPNMIAMFLGLICLLTQVKLPELVCITLDDVAATVGPLSMLVTGLIVGEMKLKDLFENKRVWVVIAFRMIICPAIIIALVLVSGVAHMIPSGDIIVMVALLSAIGPAAANVNQFAILYNKESGYAASINVLSTLSCIITIPMWMAVFQMLV